MTSITPEQVMDALVRDSYGECDDIASALNDPAIRKLVVTACVEAVTDEILGDLVAAIDTVMCFPRRKYVPSIKRAILVALCPTTEAP